MDFGNLLVSLQKYEEAGENYLKAICKQEKQREVAEQNGCNYLNQCSSALNRLSILYRNIKNYDKALELLGQAKNILEEQNQESFELYTEKIRNSWEFAREYAALSNHPKAKSYYLHTLELLEAQLVFAGRTMPEDTDKFLREAELYSEKAGDSEGVEYFQNYCFGPSGQKDTEGEEIQPDLDLGTKYIKLSAEQGNVEAQFLLGILFENGDIGECNMEEAIKWYGLAAEQGHKAAIKKLKVLK